MASMNHLAGGVGARGGVGEADHSDNAGAAEAGETTGEKPTFAVRSDVVEEYEATEFN